MSIPTLEEVIPLILIVALFLAVALFACVG